MQVDVEEKIKIIISYKKNNKRTFKQSDNRNSFPVVRCGRGVMLTPHPLLVPRSKIE